MSSEDIFKNILSIDTLLSFDGVIPSLSEFQLKLVTLIEQFCLTLQSEGHNETEVDRLCHQLCHYMDKRAANSIKENGLNWEGYSLVHYFYGYVAPFSTDSESLEVLLNSDDATVSQYALKILSLTQNLSNRDETSAQLLSRYSHRSLRQSVTATVADIEPELAPELGAKETNEVAKMHDSEILPERNRTSRPFYVQFFALILLLSLLWFWCSRYLGDLS